MPSTERPPPITPGTALENLLATYTQDQINASLAQEKHAGLRQKLAPRAPPANNVPSASNSGTNAPAETVAPNNKKGKKQADNNAPKEDQRILPDTRLKRIHRHAAIAVSPAIYFEALSTRPTIPPPQTATGRDSRAKSGNTDVQRVFSEDRDIGYAMAGLARLKPKEGPEHEQLAWRNATELHFHGKEPLVNGNATLLGHIQSYKALAATQNGERKCKKTLSLISTTEHQQAANNLAAHILTAIAGVDGALDWDALGEDIPHIYAKMYRDEKYSCDEELKHLKGAKLTEKVVQNHSKDFNNFKAAHRRNHLTPWKKLHRLYFKLGPIVFFYLYLNKINLTDKTSSSSLPKLLDALEANGGIAAAGEEANKTTVGHRYTSTFYAATGIARALHPELAAVLVDFVTRRRNQPQENVDHVD
uniref:Uncharacterized protein n=1 Tax=Mycena chlorophos TaxID=658473 RepID=A0ABQ0L0D5_MYCCL|nr:predicted protein [Mycena chlorophos]